VEILFDTEPLPLEVNVLNRLQLVDGVEITDQELNPDIEGVTVIDREKIEVNVGINVSVNMLLFVI
jgi:predicted transcriptional regulator